LIDKYKRLFIDIDGVMTKPYFAYTRFGKNFKFFSADDSEAIKLLEKYVEIIFVTADRRGYPISRKRIVKDMKKSLYLVSAEDRLEWIRKFGFLGESIYIGDSFTDINIFKAVGVSYCPHDASEYLKPFASFILNAKGGERAVAEACIEILKSLNKFDFG
jgi:3-deoxy-D-manno-octulosonate 8-phosphate phosphatase (KDO 8-P phosphatase)